MTAQGVHASLQENFRSSWRNWKGGLLTRCGHHCDAQTYARLFFFFFSLFFFYHHPLSLVHSFVSFISFKFPFLSRAVELTTNAFFDFALCDVFIAYDASFYLRHSHVTLRNSRTLDLIRVLFRIDRHS